MNKINKSKMLTKMLVASGLALSVASPLVALTGCKEKKEGNFKDKLEKNVNFYCSDDFKDWSASNTDFGKFKTTHFFTIFIKDLKELCDVTNFTDKDLSNIIKVENKVNGSPNNEIKITNAKCVGDSASFSLNLSDKAFADGDFVKITAKFIKKGDANTDCTLPLKEVKITK